MPKHNLHLHPITINLTLKLTLILYPKPNLIPKIVKLTPNPNPNHNLTLQA